MLAVPQKDGRTYRETIEPLARRGHAGSIQELEDKPLPDVLEYLWRWFLQLDAMREPSMSGLAPITPKNLEAWRELYEIRTKPYEIDAIVRIDQAFRRELNKGIEALRPPTR
jgi:hypothetical protein